MERHYHGSTVRRHEVRILVAALYLPLTCFSSRDRLAFSKSILRRFIRDCVDRDAAVASPWTVKPPVAAPIYSSRIREGT